MRRLAVLLALSLASVAALAGTAAAATPVTGITVTYPYGAASNSEFARLKVAIKGAKPAHGWVIYVDYATWSGGSSDLIETTSASPWKAGARQTIPSDLLGDDFTVYVAACDAVGDSTVDFPAAAGGYGGLQGFPCAGLTLADFRSQTRTFVQMPDATFVGGSRADQRAHRVRFRPSETGKGWITPTGWTLRWAPAQPGTASKEPGARWRTMRLLKGKRSAVLTGVGEGYWALRLVMHTAHGDVVADASGVYFDS